ncbi:LysR family transcriptional regulator [Microvirga lotononidis]|uniref:Transcriptional regulator n=1 Tax=Microvirga lotononidis TaxID=864069 RepID=I4YMB6_9HYPH|nr:LysR family transcriptional regulator [Microvirga lotononidis]EIM25108.1 transcriptional regulator [Microvirga lotononidis]WQO29401.1 LysR family transcriptional regulator [Microvirga lotononidis]
MRFSFNDLHVFVQAVEHGGFAAAARQLNMPKSTISKRVAELEADLGIRLIHRTSRSFVLTDVGRDFYDHARAAVIEAEAAESVVQRRREEPQGLVRITASVPVAQYHLAHRLPALARAYPRLDLQLHITDRFVDLVREGFDIAIRSHFSPLPDSDLVQRRMAVERIILVAAPDYLALQGVPKHPEDIVRHDGLLTGPTTRTWRLTHKDGRDVQVTPAPRLVADESLVLLRAAAAGLGIACLPESIPAAAMEAGELTGVLPDWSAGSVTSTILTPHRRSELSSVRAVIDFLAGT